MSPGEVLGVAATAIAFGWLLGPMAVEEAHTALERVRHTTTGVCRGCGDPVALAAMLIDDGVPYCSTECAMTYPNHYPEETK